eukprot:gene3780-4039_t
MTRLPGADGVGACLAPPGSELKSGSTEISPCEVGWYKPDWNRNPCVRCGANLDTADVGSVSKDACRVPAGYGLVSLYPLVARICTQNTYGDTVARPAASSSRCQSCPARMVTLDVFTGVDATTGYTSSSDCVVIAGFGTTQSNLVEQCDIGTFNPGGNRLPCSPCASGFTTLAAGARNASDCVVQPGWALDPASDPPLVKPCDPGFYSTGGNTSFPNAVCEACPAGYTTQEAASTAATDCSFCQTGRGGGSCSLCPYDTYSSTAIPVDQPCTSCPADYVSVRGATDSGMCYQAMQSPNRDYFTLSDDTAWVTEAASISATACELACQGDATCLQYRFTTDPDTPTCQLLRESAAGTQQVGFKVAGGVDYAVFRLPDSLFFGRQLGSLFVQPNRAACIAQCNGNSDCEAFSFIETSGDCKMITSDFDPAWRGKFHVLGNRLNSDVGSP